LLYPHLVDNRLLILVSESQNRVADVCYGMVGLHTTKAFIGVVPTVVLTIADPLPHHAPTIVTLMIHHLTAVFPPYNTVHSPHITHS